MGKVIYVNGQYRPYDDALVHVEDRGFQFGDAVYEVCEVVDGRLVDETRHLDRLERSLGELAMAMPMARSALGRVMREAIRRNRVGYGSVYLQVSRGSRPRDFLFPGADVPPTLVVIARHASRAAADARSATGIGVITMPDPRWNRCDIKTVMLLPASMAKEQAKAKGAREAWFLDADGHVTEGASSNAWIVTADGTLVTRPADHRILRGVTRATVMDVLALHQLRLVERSFTVAEALAAKEAFITSASNAVTPVTSIDGQSVGVGRPGPVSAALRAAFYGVAEIAPA